MSFNVTIQLWWAVPLAVTIASYWWACWASKDDHGYLAGVVTLICFVPALFVSMLAWIVGAFCK